MGCMQRHKYGRYDIVATDKNAGTYSTSLALRARLARSASGHYFYYAVQ